ncbi:MAG TPA: DNA polymerase IV [Gemmatimonadales bacterium]|jgi:DNA polymerase-4|nr:DNA polymerase IV [Gemmatimonadales bacterium]
MPRRILLADCDQMFVAVARLVDPEGAGRARLLVVGGRAQSRGVVCSASYEARAFGLRAGMPIARAVQLCPGASFVPVPRKACGVKHGELRRILAEWAPVVEPASIDEFYLDLSGTERVYRGEPLDATARRLRADVLARSGLTLSIGGGTNRLVAKLAAERAKPRPGSGGTGVLIVPAGEEAGFLAEHSLADIPGVGPRLTATLKRYGLSRVSDALRVDGATFEQWLGPRAGRWLFERIRGKGSEDVDSSGLAKSMSHEETFARDLVSDEALETRLLRLVTSLAASLREEGLGTGCITVKIRDHDFKTRQASRTVPEPLWTDRAIYAVARELLAGLRVRRRAAARLLGVSFAALTPGDGPAQLTMLPAGTDRGETARERRLARAVDDINRKLGERVIGPARLVRSGGSRSPSPPPSP